MHHRCDNEDCVTLSCQHCGDFKLLNVCKELEPAINPAFNVGDQVIIKVEKDQWGVLRRWVAKSSDGPWCEARGEKPAIVASKIQGPGDCKVGVT